MALRAYLVYLALQKKSRSSERTTTDEREVDLNLPVRWGPEVLPLRSSSFQNWGDSDIKPPWLFNLWWHWGLAEFFLPTASMEWFSPRAHVCTDWAAFRNHQVQPLLPPKPVFPFATPALSSPHFKWDECEMPGVKGPSFPVSVLGVCEDSSPQACFPSQRQRMERLWGNWVRKRMASTGPEQMCTFQNYSRSAGPVGGCPPGTLSLAWCHFLQQSNCKPLHCLREVWRNGLQSFCLV